MMKNLVTITLNIALIVAVLATYTSSMNLTFEMQTNWAGAMPQINAALFFTLLLTLAFVLKKIFWTSEQVSASN